MEEWRLRWICWVMMIMDKMTLITSSQKNIDFKSNVFTLTISN